MDSMVSVDSDVVTLAWVIDAFEYVLKHNHTKLIPYLIEISEELAFEMEMAAYRASLLTQSERQTA
jgi:hypothetical protein